MPQSLGGHQANARQKRSYGLSPPTVMLLIAQEIEELGLINSNRHPNL